MFDNLFNQLLNDIRNNQIIHINLAIPSPHSEPPVAVAPLQTWEGHTELVWRLAVLPDGSLVSSSDDGTLRHWDVQSGECLSVWKGHAERSSNLAVLPDGSIVSASHDTTLRHWDTQSGQCLSVWKGHTGPVYALAVLPDGSLVSASHDTTLRHWDTQSGQCLSVWKWHTGLVTALAVLPDGSLVSASHDATLRHWDTQSGQCLSVWKGHTGPVYALAVLHDGSLVSASYDTTLRHWDAQSGQCLSVWQGHTVGINDLAVLPDGSVVSAGRDGTLRHWDAQSGQCFSIWRGDTDELNGVALLPDGSIVSGSDDKTIRLWPVPPKLVSLAQVADVLEALKDNRSVQSFALSGATFTPTMIKALTQVVAKHPQLSSLSLERSDLTDEGVEPLLQALKKPVSKITQLNLLHNPQLSQETQTAVQQAIELRQVQYPAPEWRTSETKDIQALLNNSLKHLDWSGASLSQAQVLGLAGVLILNHSLRSLSLEDAQVETLGVQSLTQALKTHPRIQKLILDENPLEEAGVSALLDLFENHPRLYRVAAADTGGSKAQRQQLKAYNKQYKTRKEQPDGPLPVVNGPGLPVYFYDRTWGGNQVIAEPVFSSALGRLVEKERLVKHGDPAALKQPVVALPLVEDHIRETVTATEPHAWHQGTVYLPQHWVLGVIEAIQAGESATLNDYWGRHPGLVSHHYETERGSLPVYRLLMNAGRQEAFHHWLEYYNRYRGDDPLLPSIAGWFIQVTQGCHALHHLIHAINAKDQARWFREVQFNLGVTGGVYHGLVHLHRPETLEADNKAIERLVAQGALPIEIDKEGYTPLMRAVMNEQYVLAELLLPYSEIHALDKAGNTALHHLAKANPSEARKHCLVKLLTLGGDNNLPNQAGETPRALVEASTEEGALGQYEALVHTAKMHHDRYVKRLENTLGLFLEYAEKTPEGKNKAKHFLKAGLLDGARSGQATTQRLHQLFFSTAPVLENPAAAPEVNLSP